MFAEVLGWEGLFCFIQFTMMTLGSEVLFHFSVCICISVVTGTYRNQSLSKADYFSKLKTIVKSVVSRVPGAFFFALRLRDSWEIIDKNTLITIELQYTAVCSSNGEKKLWKTSVWKNSALAFSSFFSLFLSCWEGGQKKKKKLHKIMQSLLPGFSWTSTFWGFCLLLINRWLSRGESIQTYQ